MKITKEPDISISNKLGNVLLFKNAFPSDEFESIKDTFNWKRNSMHGNHDRMIWDGTKITKTHDQKVLLDHIGDKISDCIGIDKLGSTNFINFYKGKKNRTFWHRDGDINPGEYVVMVSFGAPRTLTFTDYRTNETYPIRLEDCDIVAFDFDFNLNTFHAVEASNTDDGERISLQYFEKTDRKLWSSDYIKKWKDTESLKKNGIAKRRTYVNKMLRSRKRSLRDIGDVTHQDDKKRQRELIGIVIFHGGCFGGGSHTYDKQLANMLKDDGFIVSRCKFNLNNVNKAYQDCKKEVNRLKKCAKKVYGIGISSGGFQAFRLNNLDGVIGLCPVLHPIQRLNAIEHTNPKVSKMQKLTLKHFGTEDCASELGNMLLKQKCKNSLIIAATNDQNVPPALMKSWKVSSNIKWIDGGHEICWKISDKVYDLIKNHIV